MPGQLETRSTEQHGTDVLRLDGKSYRVADAAVDRLLERRSGQVIRLSDGKRCALRLGTRSLHKELLALRRGLRAGSNLPHVVGAGRDPALGPFLLTSWIGDGSNAQEQFAAQRAQNHKLASADLVHRRFLPLVRSLLGLHHVAEIVHGDVSLANMVLGEHDGYALVDYGFAFPASRTTRRSLDRGTPGFAPPEQWFQLGTIDFRADQFATSVAAYVLLTGRFPYERKGGMEQDMTLRPEPPSLFNSSVWPQFDAVITRGLSLDKDSRYPTTREWLQQWEAAAPDAWKRMTWAAMRSWWRRTVTRFFRI